MPEARFRRILFALLGAATMTAPAAAADAPQSTLDVAYTVAFWAVPFGHTRYEGKIAANSYDAKMHFETGGVVSVFWSSTIDANVNGKIAAHTVTPTIYDSYSQDHNSKKQRVKVSFADGNATLFADPPFKTNKYPVSEEQKKGAIDPMSAITQILTGVKADAKNPCGTGAQVFDGRRRYDVTLTYVKDEPVKLTNGQFNGTAHLCQLHYNQIAGFKQKIVAEGKALPPMFADFADVASEGAPSGHYVILVKAWSTLSLGTVTVTLDSAKVDGKTPFTSVKS